MGKEIIFTGAEDSDEALRVFCNTKNYLVISIKSLNGSGYDSLIQLTRTDAILFRKELNNILRNYYIKDIE